MIKNREGTVGDRIGRRGFLKESLRFGLASALGVTALGPAGRSAPAAASGTVEGIAVASGPDYGKDALKAVELLGGMGRFVPKGASVAILANSQSRHPGTFTGPEVLRSVIRMSKRAGAAHVDCLSWLNEKNWKDSGLAAVIEEEGAALILVPRTDENFERVPVPKGTALTEAWIMKEALRRDVLINVPVTKDHAGNRFTGALKNLMGLNAPESNRGFHKENWDTDASALEHLDRSIADLNTVVTPTLCIVDATEFIVTNGPFGPGELRKPGKVVAGIDRVAIDAYCASLWGLKAREIGTIRYAYANGLGEIDLAAVRVRETTV